MLPSASKAADIPAYRMRSIKYWPAGLCSLLKYVRVTRGASSVNCASTSDWRRSSVPNRMAVPWKDSVQGTLLCRRIECHENGPELCRRIECHENGPEV